MAEMNQAGMVLMNLASGTSTNPASARMPMLTMHFGKWNTDFMGTGFLVDTQQSGPRGGDKFYSSNWAMASAQHSVGSRGSFGTDLMLSLEPASITDRSYPLLFQTGETAYGKPLVDGQHPHNFIMSLGVHYTHQLGERTFGYAYFAPVGDPAFGPVAFPHRASAMELPQAPISHHLQDSTHIVNDVVTLGISHRKIKLEASGFHGAEPGENRWTIGYGPIDSWSARLWFFPTRNWAAQVSTARLTRPEALEPGDQVRVTSSLHYSRPMKGADWSSSFIWGRNHRTESQRNLNSYLVESAVPVRAGNWVTGRFELVDKDELFAGTVRIAGYTIGYTRDFQIFQNIQTGLGANFTFNTLPDAIKPYYGQHPVGGVVFVRFRLRPPS